MCPCRERIGLAFLGAGAGLLLSLLLSGWFLRLLLGAALIAAGCLMQDGD